MTPPCPPPPTNTTTTHTPIKIIPNVDRRSSIRRHRAAMADIRRTTRSLTLVLVVFTLSAGTTTAQSTAPAAGNATANSTAAATSRPALVKVVGGLLCYTLTRTMMAGQLKSAKMFGGENPDGWFGPWFSDTILGLLTPFAIYGAFTGEGVVAWGLLLSFNALGAYDYMNGLLAQYMHPMVKMLGNPAPPAAVIYGSIGLGCLCQIVNVILLLQNDAIQFFIETD